MSLVALEDIIKKKKTTLTDSDTAKISKILGEQCFPRNFIIEIESE